MNMLTRNSIAIKKLGAIFVPTVPASKAAIVDNEEMALAFQANVMDLGFILTDDAVATIRTLSKEDAERLYKDTISTLRQMKGANVKHKPMYPNFPTQVMEASEVELFINALVHYWTAGHWMPEYEKEDRPFAFENTKFIPLGVATADQVAGVFTSILSSADSISDEDKSIVEAFFENEKVLKFPENIPFKENMCLVAGLLFQRGKYNLEPVVKTTTDVLRVATYLSDGDISLAENTKFKSFPRKERQALVSLLENVISAEDLVRHRGKWIRLFHSLHVGELSQKVARVASKIRNNNKIETFNGQVEDAIRRRDIDQAVQLLSTRPGDFARRVSHLLRISRRRTFIVDAFLAVADKVPTRNLLQLLGHLNTRHEDVTKRIVFPKGMVQRAHVVRNELPKMSDAVRRKLGVGLQHILAARFSEQENLGKVWIDPALKSCPLPTQMRSASEGLLTVARGTQLPFDDDKTTLRLFIYWKGRDLDLSATFHKENFEYVDHISYTHLKSGTLKAYHSGDITRAPRGASEFIDVDIEGALKAGVRYVAMNVLSYSQEPFADMNTCFCGWMTRSKPQSNEIYEPKTVEQKVDLRSNTRNAMPVIFDLQERKAIWVDLTTRMQTSWGGNNVESNMASIEEIIEAIIDSANKVSLYHLFALHAAARGEVVNDKEEADVIFGFDRSATVSPYDVTTINSSFMV